MVYRPERNGLLHQEDSPRPHPSSRRRFRSHTRRRRNNESAVRAVPRRDSDVQDDIHRMYPRRLPPLPQKGGGPGTADPRGEDEKHRRGRIFGKPICFADAIRHFRGYLIRNYKTHANGAIYFSNRASVCPFKSLCFRSGTLPLKKYFRPPERRTDPLEGIHTLLVDCFGTSSILFSLDLG